MITTLCQQLKENGILPTPQRLAVFECVAGCRNHPSVDDVYATLRGKLPTLSKTTVYSTMQLLAGRGLIGVLHGVDEELRYDGIRDFHAHFKCTGCGRLFDIAMQAPHRNPFAHLPEGFRLDDEELTYYGRCPACAQAAESPGA